MKQIPKGEEKICHHYHYSKTLITEQDIIKYPLNEISWMVLRCGEIRKEYFYRVRKIPDIYPLANYECECSKCGKSFSSLEVLERMENLFQ